MNGAEHLLSETEIDRALGYPDEVFASEKEILKLLRAQHAKTLALCSERRAREMAMLADVERVGQMDTGEARNLRGRKAKGRSHNHKEVSA